MSGGQRALLIVVAAAIAVGGFLLLRPDDEDSDKPATTQSTAATDTTAADTTQAEAEPEPEKPATQTIEVRDGDVVGGLQELEAKQGDTVTFQVKSDAEHEIHLHGYDIAKDVSPEKPVTFKLKADETGIFEIELEDTKTEIAELKVEP